MATPLQSVPTNKLTTRQGAPKSGSIVSTWRTSVADSLTPQRLASVMRQADEGDITAYLTLAEEMEEREPHYASVLFTRKLSVSGTVPVVESPDDSPAAKTIVEAVEKRITRTPAFEGLVQDLMDGVGKGFSCCEILWQHDEAEWYPRGYEFREQRHFTFDEDTALIPQLRTEAEPDKGEPLKPYSWIVHKPKLRSGIPIRTGLARTVAVCYACKRWTVADWMAFLDIYGIPVRVGKYPSHMAAQKKALLKAIVAIGSDAACVIPKEMEVDIIEAKGGMSGNSTFFQQSAEYWDKQTSKVVLGQTMTTDDGASLSQSKTHENTRFDIRDADSRAVGNTIDRDLVKPFVDLNFGPQKVYPSVIIRQRKSEELVPLMTATKIYVDMGGRVQASVARDRLGYPEPEEGAELLQPTAAVVAKSAPRPEPPTKAGDVKEGDPAGDDEEIDPQGKPGKGKPAGKELNAASVEDRTEDEVDVRTAEELADWRSLEETNVGRLIQLIQTSPSYAEARALLDELDQDAGEVLDVGALVESLARETLKLRGNGDATDEVKP